MVYNDKIIMYTMNTFTLTLRYVSALHHKVKIGI